VANGDGVVWQRAYGRADLEFDVDATTEHLFRIGSVSKVLTTVAAAKLVSRGLLELEHEGGEKLLGEPALNIDDLMQAERGQGVINILASEKLLGSPKLYSTFLLWLLSELFEHLPEVGDPEKPKLVFFFDEAHLLFSEAPKALLEKIEQVVRLIRSKGVGVYFVTQNPLDIPDSVLGQLGNRVQHALRAFTPKDQKAVKAAAQTMRANPKLAAQVATRWIPGLKQDVAEAAMQFNIQQNDRRLSANNYRALWAAQERLNRLGILKSTFDVNKHIEPKHILNVMKNHPELFKDLPPIPASAAIGPGYVFKP